MTQYAGFVAKIGHKSGNGKRGPWNLYSVKLEKEDGSEHPWISLGFRDDPPPFKEGEYITVEANPNDRGDLAYVEGSGKKPKNPPARAAKQSSSRGSGASSGNGGFRKGGNGGGGYKADGTGISNRTNPEDAKRMSYANARSSAIEVIGLLIANKALPLSAGTAKAGEAKRFDEVLKAIDKLTVEYYNDGMSLRKLETVADAGVVNTAPDGQIPSEPVKHAIDEDDRASTDESEAADADDVDAGLEDNDDDGAF